MDGLIKQLSAGCYHNIPRHTPQGGYHGVTKVNKSTNMAKMAANYISTLLTLPTNLGVGIQNHFFGSKSKKPSRFVIFDLK